MSNIIELNIAEIDTVVGGTISARTSAPPPPPNYNRTMMVTPNVPTSSFSSAPLTTSSDLQARFEALR